MSLVTNSTAATSAVAFAAPALVAAKQLPVDQKTESLSRRLLSNIVPYITKQNTFYLVCGIAIPTAFYFAYKYIPSAVNEYRKNNILHKLNTEIDQLTARDEVRLKEFNDGKEDALPEVKSYDSKEDLKAAMVAVNASYLALVDAAQKEFDKIPLNKDALKISLDKVLEKVKTISAQLRAEILSIENNKKLNEENILEQLTTDVEKLVKKDEERLKAFKDETKQEPLPEVKEYTTKEELEAAMIAVSAQYTKLVETAQNEIGESSTNKEEVKKSIDMILQKIKLISDKLCDEILLIEKNKQLVPELIGNKNLPTTPNGSKGSASALYYLPNVVVGWVYSAYSRMSGAT